jgi:signal transduction histidine kinase
MPLDNLLRRALTARLALPLIAVAVVAALVVNEWTSRRTEALRLGRAQLYEARLNSMEVLQLLTDAETSHRGYLITDREEYLGLYRDARAALPAKLHPALQSFRALGADVAGFAEEAARLVDAKLAELETTITLQRSGKRELAVEMVMTNLGKETMDKLRAQLGGALERAAQQDVALAATIQRELNARRWAIHGLVILIALAAAAYGRRLAAQARERETERARLEQEVATRTADLRELAAHLQTVQESERSKLSRELHDEIGGLLTAAKLDLARLRTLRDPSALPERVKSLGARLDEIVAIKRRIIEGLRPSSLEHLGLRAALELLCQEVAERLGITIDTRIDDTRLADELQITAYRIVQEALTNVQKYAQARTVQVRLAVATQQVHLIVADDGAGFDVTVARVNRHGLAGMRYRVESLGGTFTLDSAAGRGTRVVATLPLVARADLPVATAEAPG